MDRDTELACVRGLRDGDALSFDAAYAAFNDRIFTFVLRLSRRRDVAEDLVEETWLRLVTHASRLQTDTRLLPWLLAVARNLYVSYVRSRVLEDAASSSGLGLWPVNVHCSSPFEETAANELERRLERAIALLPSASREAVLLVAVAGLDPADAAAVCGIAPEALRQRLSSARRQLARALDAQTPVTTAVPREVLP